MSKNQIIIILGIWTMLFLFLGFPFFWDKIIALVTGVLVVGCAYSLRNTKSTSDTSRMHDIKKHNTPYVEHRGVPDRSITSDPATTG